MACNGYASDSSGGEWDETSLEDVPCVCLFCKEEGRSAEAVLSHISEQHNWDLQAFVFKLGLDFYSSVKLINYIRKKRPSVAELLKTTPPFPWCHDDYLAPVVQDDPLLQLDFEPCEITQNGLDHDRRLEEAESRLTQCQESLQRALDELNEMRQAVQNIVGEESEELLRRLEEDQDGCGHEDGYFASYSHYQIHEDMLKDTVRMDTYRHFIESNPSVVSGKVVLDVGCGTGILSMLAARAGARQVYAVDNSDIIHKAKDIIRENHLSDKIILIQGKVEEISLPVDKVDVIISEWMGYFLLFESMLDSVLFARDKWLVDANNFYPNRAVMCIQAVANTQEYNSKLKFWDNVAGFSMQCMKRDVLKEPGIEFINDKNIISSCDTFKMFDLVKTSLADVDFVASFSITMHENNTCNAFLGFFDVSFESVPSPVYMSTGPAADGTHWKQTVFYLVEPVQVCDGDRVSGEISVRKNTTNPRGLVVDIEYELHSVLQEAPWNRRKQTFTMD